MPRPSGAFAAFILWLVAITLLDRATPVQLDLSIFYALAVVVAGWFMGKKVGVLTGLISSMMHLVADAAYLGGGGYLAGNEVFHTALLVLLGWAAGQERERVRKIAEQRDELAQAQASIRSSLEAAQRVQRAFLTQDLPDDPRVEVFIRFSTTMKLGGDFYDIHREGDWIYACVADVSGKGPPAALVTGLLRGFLDANRKRRGRPDELLTRINGQLFPYIPEEMFVTCIFVALNLASGELVYASAGHDPGMLRRAGSVDELPATGLPLGVMPENPVDACRMTVAPDDILLLYTDGLVNARFDEEERLGDLRVKETLRAHQGDVAGLVGDLFSLTEDLREASQEDDVVVMALRRLGGVKT